MSDACDDVVTAPIDALRRFGRELGTAPDGNAKVPGLDWTVSELGAHVLAGARFYQQSASERVPGWRDLQSGPEENARLMRDLVPEHDVADIVAAIPSEADKLGALWSQIDPETVIPWHGNLELSVRTITGLVLADVSVHRWDLGRVISAPADISRADATRAFAAVVPIAPDFVDKEGAGGVRAVFDIALRGGPRYGFAFADAVLTVADGKPAHADCHINADPVALMLVTYGRVSPVRAGATGKVMAYGRKPWLAFKLTSFLRNP